MDYHMDEHVDKYNFLCMYLLDAYLHLVYT